MKNNSFLKITFFTFILGLICLSLSGYAAQRAVQDNPDLVNQVAEKLKANNVHIVFEGDDEFKSEEKIWKFKPDIKSIQIHVVHGSVDILDSPTDEIQIQASGIPAGETSELVDLSKDGKTILVDQKRHKRINGVTVLVPKGYNGNLEISSISGDIKLKSTNLNKISAKLVSGEFQATETSVKSIDVSSVSGDIEVESKESGNLNLESTSGDIHLKLANPNQYRYRVSTASGEVNNPHQNSETATQEAVINTISGDIEIE